MNKNAQYWLNRVAVKLHRDFLAGMDFEHDEHRWLFDWDEDLDTEKNLENVAAEDKALIVFTQTGAIDTTRKDNFYRTQQLESFADPLRGHIIWGNWGAFDPPKREYEYLRFIDNIYIDKFLAFCNGQGLTYKEDAVLATLEIINEAPIIHVGEKTYTLKTLQDGSPLDVIRAAYDHADIRFGFSELHQWTNQSFNAQKRFTDIFRKNEFSNGKELSPFVDIAPKTFLLKKQVRLTPQQLATIQKVSTN